MKRNAIFVCILFIVISLSCKKEDTVNVGSVAATSKVPLLSQVKTDNQPSYAYSYNMANLMSEEKSKYDFSLYHYNDKNQLTSVDYYANYNILSSDLLVVQTAMARNEFVTADNANKGGCDKYEYNDKDQLIKSTYSPLSGSIQYSEFTYDSNNKINKQILYWENEETGYIVYSYDGNGNLIEENLYVLTSPGVAELSTTTQYEFDNSPNPYKAICRLMVPGLYSNTNNITKETYTIRLKASQGPDKVQVIQNSYKYNSKGYPTNKNGNVEYIYS